MPKRSLTDQLDHAVEAMLARTDSSALSAVPGLAALLRIAASLRGLPDEAFKARLKSDLERRANMSTTAATTSKVKAIPEGYYTATPYLCVKDAARAIEFYKQALGATEIMRLTQPDGRIGHAEIKVGDSPIMLSDEFPDYGSLSPQSIGGSPVIIHLYVEDVDALAARASAAGVNVTVEDQDYGDRSGGFTDPFGHKWNISTHKEDITGEELRRRYSGEASTPAAKPARPIPEGFHTATPHLTVSGGVKAIEFYKRAFGARETESMRFVDPDGRIAHAELTIGDSRVMLADEAPDYGRRGPQALGGSPVMVHLYVEDVDAVANQAVAAGAKVQRPVQNQFYGDRAGKLEDPFGHVWFIATHKEDVPPEEMRKRLAAFNRRESTAGASEPVQPIPKGFHSVTPYLVVEDAPKLLDFVKGVFGAEELFHAVGSAGGLHAEVRIGDSRVMIGGGGPGLAWKGTAMPTALHLYVKDVDAVYRRALEAGATSIGEPADHDYGERGASVKDSAGNEWYIATAKGESYIPEGLRNVNLYLHPRGADRLIDFLTAAFGAQQVSRYAQPGGPIVYASVRIGDAIVEMSEAHGPYQPMPSMIYLYVKDADTTYKSAVAAGGTSLFEPVDQPYGDRNGGVEDPFGNQWYIATHVKDMAH